MRTPCQDDPDLWTSKRPEERLVALQACQGCHRLAACKAETADPDERIGVRGGIDWTVSKNGESLAPIRCANPRCGRLLLRTPAGVRRRHCDETCRRAARSAA